MLTLIATIGRPQRELEALPASLSPARTEGRRTLAREDFLRLRTSGEEAGVQSLAKHYLSDRSEPSFERFAEALRKTPSLQPRMTVGDACTGSSATTYLADSLMQKHGVDVEGPSEPNSPAAREELFKCEKNPECAPAAQHGQQQAQQQVARVQLRDLINHVYGRQDLFDCEKNPECTQGNVSIAMRSLVAKAVVDGKVLLFKGMPGLDMGQWATMRRMGTRVAVSWRFNSLEHLVCMVRDCFDDMYGSDAAARVGKNTDACFSRRSLPSDEQPRAWLNTSVLLREMERIHKKDWERPAEPLLDNGWQRDDFETTMHEDLFGHETDASDKAFETAVGAWKRTLRSLGVEPDEQTVREALQQERGTRPASQLNASVVNADAVAVTLAKAGEPFSAMVPGAWA